MSVAQAPGEATLHQRDDYIDLVPLMSRLKELQQRLGAAPGGDQA